MSCSVVIRAFNEAEHIGKLLEGIRHQTIADPEVILVDSGSSDSTVDIARKYGAQILQISAEDFSFGRSLNLGLEAAQRDYVVVASAHVYPVYPDWLEHLLRPFEDARVAVVYGKQRGTDASKFSERQIFHQWYPDADAMPQESPFCNNANAAIRRRLWEVHSYDETLTGLEDVEWAKWAQLQGYTVCYTAHAEVIHVHRETLRGVYARYEREAMAFKRIFPESHFSFYDFVRLTISNALSDLVHALRETRPWRYPASILWFRIMQFWGTYQGYRRSGPLTQQLRQTFYYPRGWQVSRSGKRDVDPIEYGK
jgi:glycosyltransferase involved in cell wall biosynthesis